MYHVADKDYTMNVQVCSKFIQNIEKESVFKNSAAVVFGRNKKDILKEKFNLKEKQHMPAPG